MNSVKHIQQPLFRLLQKFQKEFDSGRFIGTTLLDLSKAFDCLRHDFLRVKLEAYGLGNGSLNFLTFITAPFISYITSLLGNKELKVVLLIVNGQKLDMEFLKDQF